MKIQFLGRNPFDRRVATVRVVFARWKVSASLEPRWFRWERSWRQFRLTLCGLALHYRGGL